METKPVRDTRHAARTASNAFTRTDLLVALFVLGLMAVWAQRIVASPRDAGYQARCQDNLRRLMVAELMYASENNDSLTWPNWGNDASVKGWAYKGTVATNQNPRSGLLWKYLQNDQVYQCPLDFDRTNDDSTAPGGSAPYKTLFANRDNKISSYAMNGAVCGYGSLAVGNAYKLSQFRPNAIAFIESDERTPFYFNDGSLFPDEGSTTRHSSGGNVSRLDGGAEFMSYQTYYKYAGPEGSRGIGAYQVPNRLWCNPGSPNGQ